jgi:hypothetical protein
MSIEITNFKQIFSEKNSTSILSGDITINTPHNEGICIPPIEESKNINIILGKSDDIYLIDEIIKSPVTNSNVTIYDFENNIIRKYVSSRKTNTVGNTFVTTDRKSMLSNIIIPHTPETKNYLLITSYPGIESCKTEAIRSKFLSLDKLENFNSKNLTVVTTNELSGYFQGVIRSPEITVVPKGDYEVQCYEKKNIYTAVAETIFGKSINDSATTLNGFLSFSPSCEAMMCKSSSHYVSMTCRTANRVQINSSKHGEVTNFVVLLQTSKPIDTVIFGSNSSPDIYTFSPSNEVLGSDKMSKIEDMIMPYINLYYLHSEAQTSKTLDVFFDAQKHNVYNFMFKNPMKEGIESLGDYENYTEFFTSIKDSLHTKFYEYINSKHFPELSVPPPRHARLPFPGAINYTGEIPMSRMFSGQ